MNTALKFAFIAGLTFLIAAEVAYGQALPPNDGTGDPRVQQHMKSDGRLAPQECRMVCNMQDRSNQ
ncbi:MAG: hypothetical protein ACM32K_04305, partial [Syntrophaceae bacterium]